MGRRFLQGGRTSTDIVLIDVQMPVGMESKRLSISKGTPACPHVSLVMLTSDSTRDTVMAAIQAGAQDYIVKNHFSKEIFSISWPGSTRGEKWFMQRVEAQAAAALGVSRATTASPATGFADPEAQSHRSPMLQILPFHRSQQPLRR